MTYFVPPVSTHANAHFFFLVAAMLDFTSNTDNWYKTWSTDETKRAFAMYVSLLPPADSS